jgi:dTDP-4-amino-4,6-dideoxygalactose transaminase
MFYLKVHDLEVRSELLEHLKSNDIWSVFHYVPLHSAKAGLNFGRFDGVDQFTTKESERVIRLPMYYGLDNKEVRYIINIIKGSYDETK